MGYFKDGQMKMKAGSKRDLLVKVKSAGCTCRCCDWSKSILKSRIHVALRQSDIAAIKEAQVEQLDESDMRPMWVRHRFLDCNFVDDQDPSLEGIGEVKEWNTKEKIS